jgi:phosphonate transport system substrate-binding protein
MTDSWQERTKSGLLWFGLLLLFGPHLTGCDSRRVEEIDLSQRAGDPGLSQAVWETGDEVLLFSFEMHTTPREDAKRYVPLIQYLNQATGLDFELRFTPYNHDLGQDLGQGVIHFALMGGVAYIRAREEYGVVALAHELNHESKSQCRSVIVVPPGSPIQNVEEIAGRTFAFGRPLSTADYLVPRIHLFKHGITLAELAGYEFAGSAYEVVSAVAAGQFDAAGVSGWVGQRYAAEGLVRIVDYTDTFTSCCIAAHQDLPLDVIEEVKRALIAYRPAESVVSGGRPPVAHSLGGFSEAKDEDYDELRTWWQRFHSPASESEGGAP